jgi:branched-chain amino acid aminotransferase
MDQGNRWAFFNGEIVPIEQAQVSVMCHALNYGTGCFEGIRAYWNEQRQQMVVFQLKPHMERLLRSCKVLHIELPYSADDLCQITVDLLRKEGFRTNCYIRPLAFKSASAIAVRLNNIADSFTLFAVPFGAYLDTPTGAKVCVSSWRRIDDNVIPARAKVTGGYINSALIKTDALLSGFDEAIVLSADGHVCESSAANLFLVRDGQLVTQPVSGDILEGITRRVVMQLASESLGLVAVERPIDRTELYLADELFFCGTGVEVQPISSVDHRTVGAGGVGPVARQLMEQYAGVVRGHDERYLEWCSFV